MFASIFITVQLTHEAVWRAFDIRTLITAHHHVCFLC